MSRCPFIDDWKQLCSEKIKNNSLLHSEYIERWKESDVNITLCSCCQLTFHILNVKFWTNSKLKHQYIDNNKKKLAYWFAWWNVKCRIPCHIINEFLRKSSVQTKCKAIKHQQRIVYQVSISGIDNFCVFYIICVHVNVFSTIKWVNRCADCVRTTMMSCEETKTWCICA